MEMNIFFYVTVEVTLGKFGYSIAKMGDVKGSNTYRYVLDLIAYQYRICQWLLFLGFAELSALNSRMQQRSGV